MSNWSPPGGPSPPQPFQPPASAFYGPPPVKKGPSIAIWIALAAGGVLLLVCGGGCGALMILGINMVEEQIIVQLRDNPKLREHIGEIETLDFDFLASQAQNGDDVFVYRVKGTKGTGKLTIREGTGDTMVAEATLRLPDGTEIKIVP